MIYAKIAIEYKLLKTHILKNGNIYYTIELFKGVINSYKFWGSIYGVWGVHFTKQHNHYYLITLSYTHFNKINSVFMERCKTFYGGYIRL
jgi:hypothetical protein